MDDDHDHPDGYDIHSRSHSDTDSASLDVFFASLGATISNEDAPGGRKTVSATASFSSHLGSSGHDNSADGSIGLELADMTALSANWDVSQSPSPLFSHLLTASHDDLMQIPLYKALVHQNKELVAANAKLHRTIGQVEGKLAGKENAYKSLLDTVTGAIARTTATGHVDPADDPADHVTEEDLQEAKAKGRFWEEKSWTPYTQGQELFSQAKKDGVPLYLENADGTTIDPKRFNLLSNAQRRVWQTLKAEGKLPSKWGQRSTYAEALHSRAMSKFREFKYCDNDYKRHRFATKRFPGWFRTHGKTATSPEEEDSDDEDDEDSPISPTVGRKRSLTMPPPERSSSNKRAKSSTGMPDAAPHRASTVQPTASRSRHPLLSPLTRTRTVPQHAQLVRDHEDEIEDEGESGGDTELDTPTIEHDVVRRSPSLSRPGPNHSAVIRLVDLTDPAKRQALQNKLRKVTDPCAHVARAPMPAPPAATGEQGSSDTSATAAQSTGSTGGGDTTGNKLRIAKKSNTARNLAAAAYKRLHPGVTTNEFSVHWNSITKPDRDDPEYEAKVQEYTLIEARRLFALAYLSTHPTAMVDELLDEFAKLTPDEIKMYSDRAAEGIAKELSKGRGKGKDKA